MSDAGSHEVHEELGEPSDTQLFSAEYKDGQLQIVEVTPFDKGDRADSGMPVLDTEGTKYVQVVNSDKSCMQLDLLNLTLVRCDDGVESYRLVSNSEAGDSSSEATVTCVLHSSDTEEVESSEAYVKVDWDQGPLVFLRSPDDEPAPVVKENKQPAKVTPQEILEKAKALQKAKQQIIASHSPSAGVSRRGRKRKSDLPPPHELLSSPNFKLFLYSCKLCTFKCNAVKEMTAHKAAEHSSGSSSMGGKWRRGAPAALQCAVCPYRGTAHSQLMKHIQDIHTDKYKISEYITPDTIETKEVSLDSSEVRLADVLVCGACGFESASRAAFRAHIHCAHAAEPC